MVGGTDVSRGGLAGGRLSARHNSCQLAVATITATGVPAKLRARDTDLICAAELGERECASELARRGLGGVSFAAGAGFNCRRRDAWCSAGTMQPRCTPPLKWMRASRGISVNTNG